MEELIKQYDEVFDKSGRIKFCGRDVCVKLILLCEREFPDAGVEFGNKSNGFLNVENIKKFVNRQYNN